MAVNFNQDSVWNLKPISVDAVKGEVNGLLIGGEEVVMAFQTVRDQLIFTNKRIIAVEAEDGGYLVLFNPVILKKSGPYETEEGCLSLTGTRKTKRFQTIKVQWQNEKFQTRIKTFTGWTAEIIQHEIDHCEGILI